MERCCTKKMAVVLHRERSGNIPGAPLAPLQIQRFFLHLEWTPGLGEMLRPFRSQGRCLDLGFAGGEGDLAFCWVGLASSEIAQILQHRVSKLLSELREPSDLVHGFSV